MSGPIGKDFKVQQGTTFPQLPVVTVQKPIDQVVKDLSHCLRQVKIYGEALQSSVMEVPKLEKKLKAEEQKPLRQAKKLQAGPEGFLANAELATLQASVEGTKKNIQTSHAGLAENSRLYKQIAKDERLVQVAKAKSLMTQIQKEFKKQDEWELKSVEKRLSAITGNKIYNAIFRIKRVKQEEIPHLLQLAKDLEEVKNRGDGILHKDRIDNLEIQIGRALMLGHDYRTEHDLNDFLSGKQFTKLSMEENRLILKYIQTKFPKKNVVELIHHLSPKEIAASQVTRTSVPHLAEPAVKASGESKTVAPPKLKKLEENDPYQKLLKQKKFETRDLKKLEPLVKGFTQWAGDKDAAIVRQVRLKLGEAILRSRDFEMPKHIPQFLSEAANPHSFMPRDQIILGLRFIQQTYPNRVDIDIEATIRKLKRDQPNFVSEW